MSEERLLNKSTMENFKLDNEIFILKRYSDNFRVILNDFNILKLLFKLSQHGVKKNTKLD